MTAAIVANGEITNYDYFNKKISLLDYIIAVDNGLHHLDKIGVSPDVIIGDLDSCSEQLLNKYSSVLIKKYPKDKDETDLELGLAFCFLKDFSKAIIFGAAGNRSDHFLGNIFSLSRYKDQAIIDSEKEEIAFIHKKKEFFLKSGQTISLIPICGPCKNITTHGLKWELKDQTLDQSFIGISNTAISNVVTVSLQTGLLLYVLQKQV